MSHIYQYSLAEANLVMFHNKSGQCINTSLLHKCDNLHKNLLDIERCHPYD